MNQLRPDQTSNHRGNVFVLQMTTVRINNLSDVTTEEEIRMQDIYGWMLEACSSGVFATVREEFEKSLKGIWLLIDFKAHSFNERQGLFEKLVLLGERLSEQEKALYARYGTTIRKEFGDRYFDDLYSYLNL